MTDGKIDPGEGLAFQLGFTPDKFEGWLWQKGADLWLSLIISREEGKGNLRTLIANALALGFTVKVPTPFARMQSIIERLGFQLTVENTDMGPCDVWVKHP